MKAQGFSMKTRQHLRVNLPIPVRVKVADRDQEFKFTGLGDISWGGAFVFMNPPAAKGSRVIIQFSLSDENVSLELWALSLIHISEPTRPY